MSFGLGQHHPHSEIFPLDQGRVIKNNSILITLFFGGGDTINIQDQYLVNLHEEDDSKKF